MRVPNVTTMRLESSMVEALDFPLPPVLERLRLTPGSILMTTRRLIGRSGRALNLGGASFVTVRKSRQKLENKGKPTLLFVMTVPASAITSRCQTRGGLLDGSWLRQPSQPPKPLGPRANRLLDKVSLSPRQVGVPGLNRAQTRSKSRSHFSVFPV